MGPPGPQALSGFRMLHCLHLAQIVADRFRTAADARVMPGEGLSDFGVVERQGFHRSFAAAAQRVVAKAGVFQLVSQKGFYLTLGRRGEFNRDLAVQFTGH